MKVKHLMSAPAITVHAETTLKEILHLLSAHQISGVPVIDRHEKVIGVISWHELLPSVKNLRPPDVRVPMLFNRIIDLQHLVEGYKEAATIIAKDLMHPSPVCAEADDEIEHVVWMMVEGDFHIIPVVSGTSLAGVLTRDDFIRFLAQEL